MTDIPRILFVAYVIFFFNDTATTEIYTLSLHDALPICQPHAGGAGAAHCGSRRRRGRAGPGRSEEHTSELQSHSDLVCRLLLEKKKTPIFTTDSPCMRNPSPA